MLALGARADAAQSARDVGAGLAIVEVELALGEERAAALEVKDVQYGVTDPEHVTSHSLGRGGARPMRARRDHQGYRRWETGGPRPKRNGQKVLRELLGV